MPEDKSIERKRARFLSRKTKPAPVISDLQHVRNWGKRLSLWVRRDCPPNEFSWMIFRPDRMASDAMVRLSIEFPFAIQSIEGHIEYSEKWLARLDEGEAAIENLAGAMHDLCDKIFIAVSAMELAQPASRASAVTKKKPDNSIKVVNKRARAMLEDHPDMQEKGCREWAKYLNCANGLITKLPVWKAIQESKPKAKSTTPRRTQSLGADEKDISMGDSILGNLAKEQEKDNNSSYVTVPTDRHNTLDASN